MQTYVREIIHKNKESDSTIELCNALWPLMLKFDMATRRFLESTCDMGPSDMRIKISDTTRGMS